MERCELTDLPKDQCAHCRDNEELFEGELKKQFEIYLDFHGLLQKKDKEK